jgi:hypothetical protein
MSAVRSLAVALAVVIAAARRGRFVTVREVTGCDGIDVTARGDRGSRGSFNLSSFVCG